MKKIMVLAITMVFAVALGVAYAGEGVNQFTDISGKTYNTTWDLYPVFGNDVRSASVEGSHAGGLREAVNLKLDKDFFSPTYDVTWGINAPEASGIRSGSVEGSHAGGSRAAVDLKLDKDFISPTYDSLSDIR